MGIFQKINNLFTKKQKIEQEIELLQKSCKHNKKSIKSIRENVDSTSPVIRWVCNECSLIIGYPNSDEINKFLNNE